MAAEGQVQSHPVAPADAAVHVTTESEAPRVIATEAQEPAADEEGVAPADTVVHARTQPEALEAPTMPVYAAPGPVVMRPGSPVTTVRAGAFPPRVVMSPPRPVMSPQRAVMSPPRGAASPPRALPGDVQKELLHKIDMRLNEHMQVLFRAINDQMQGIRGQLAAELTGGGRAQAGFPGMARRPDSPQRYQGHPHFNAAAAYHHQVLSPPQPHAGTMHQACSGAESTVHLYTVRPDTQPEVVGDTHLVFAFVSGDDRSGRGIPDRICGLVTVVQTRHMPAIIMPAGVTEGGMARALVIGKSTGNDMIPDVLHTAGAPRQVRLLAPIVLRDETMGVALVTGKDTMRSGVPDWVEALSIPTMQPPVALVPSARMGGQCSAIVVDKDTRKDGLPDVLRPPHALAPAVAAPVYVVPQTPGQAPVQAVVSAAPAPQAAAAFAEADRQGGTNSVSLTEDIRSKSQDFNPPQAAAAFAESARLDGAGGGSKH